MFGFANMFGEILWLIQILFRSINYIAGAMVFFVINVSNRSGHN